MPDCTALPSKIICAEMIQSGSLGAMQQEKMTWPAPGAWVTEFLRFLELERGYSDKTVRNYQHALADFVRTREVKSWKAAKTEDFRAYLYELSVRRGMGSGTVRLHFSALRSFYRYQVKQRKIKASPLGDLSLPAVRKRLPRIFNESQITAFLDAPLQMMRDAEREDAPRRRGRAMTAWQFLRDAAILEFLYSTGIRIHELVGMNDDDIDRRSLAIRVLGKGNKERMVILGEPAIEAYERYRMSIRASPVPAFVSAGDKRLTARSVQQRFKIYLEYAGLDNALTPHKLRHSFATHMLDHGADLRNVQELLGHANLSTTQIYAQLTAERMRKSYDKAHPAARTL